ncbi:MAG: site-2 protease family protein [Planctomycetota bacterium]|jgi:Zn-dependent protease
MNWSWNVGTLAGIRVYIHWTLLALVALVGWSSRHAEGGALVAMALYAGVFTCILLHELGHALAARRYGIGTRSITLFPFGGIAALERMPSTPKRELVVALAGPAVNVVIALLLLPVALLTGHGLTLLVINLILVAFNLLPAFPMDGGRVLRAALASRMDPVRATRIAVGIGRAIAACFVVAGILWNPFLILIAIVVWTQGAAELRSMQRPQQVVLSPHDTLERPLAVFARTGQGDFPVRNGPQLVGILSRETLSLAFARFGPQMTVGAVMEPVRS